MKTALLISTYNWPESLDLVLKSLASQTIFTDEILIADDGSKQETKQLILDFQKKITIPVQHFWQEDIGFRKSKILNKAVAGTRAEYIIQIDGDCIMHPRFIEDHINFACKGVYSYGSRVNILPDFVTKVFEDKKIKFNFFSKEIKNRTRTFHIPFFSKLYKSHKGISKKFRGCNVSFWREDFISINGYNEDYEGWGKEDSDLAIRLGNNGIKARRLRYSGIVYHIHHKINSKHNFEWNDKMQNETISKMTVRIENGINQYFKNE